MSLWTDYLPLDAAPEAPLALLDHYEMRRRLAILELAKGLAAAGAPALGRRLTYLAEISPQVLSSAAAWQWMREVLGASQRRDAAAISGLADGLARFEVAAAVLSGGDWDGPWPHTARGPVVLPMTGMFVERSQVADVTVHGGKLSVDTKSLPSIRGVTLDMWDDMLRGPALDRFDFVLPVSGPPADAASFASQIAEALALAEVVCPALVARLSTTVVPVRAPAGWVEAATDEDGPGITYCSFGRSPADLLAAFAHEESHALLNAAVAAFGVSLPKGDGLMDVPWKPEPRPLPAVIHGLAAFGRASTIRQRARQFSSALTPDEDQLADEEGRWVREVSERVLAGALGDLPPDVRAWIETNTDRVGTAAPIDESDDLGVVAQSSTSSPYRWWLLQGEAATTAAASAYLLLRQAHWTRHITDFSRQDGANLADLARGEQVDQLRGFFADTVPRMLSGVGLNGRLQDLVAHRLRPGDAVGLHNDADQSRFHFRCILGVTPGHLSGGQLQLWGAASRPLLSVQPGFGDLLVLEPNQRAFHEIELVGGERFRLTMVGSYLDPSRIS